MSGFLKPLIHVLHVVKTRWNHSVLKSEHLSLYSGFRADTEDSSTTGGVSGALFTPNWCEENGKDCAYVRKPVSQ